jgi:hypothetical protein
MSKNVEITGGYPNGKLFYILNDKINFHNCIWMFLPFQVLYVIEEIASGRTENENASGKVMVSYKPSTSTFTFIVPIVLKKKMFILSWLDFAVQIKLKRKKF